MKVMMSVTGRIRAICLDEPAFILLVDAGSKVKVARVASDGTTYGGDEVGGHTALAIQVIESAKHR